MASRKSNTLEINNASWVGGGGGGGGLFCYCFDCFIHLYTQPNPLTSFANARIFIKINLGSKSQLVVFLSLCSAGECYCNKNILLLLISPAHILEQT